MTIAKKTIWLMWGKVYQNLHSGSKNQLIPHLELQQKQQQILKQKHKRENSMDVKPSSLLVIDMNTIYNTSHREKSRGQGVIRVAHNNSSLRLTNSQIQTCVIIQLIARGHKWER